MAGLPKANFIFQPAPFRILYAEALIEPTQYRDRVTGALGDWAYNAQYLIPKNHPQFAQLDSTLAQLAMTAFGTVQGVVFPLDDGDQFNHKRVAEGKKAYDHYFGHFILRVKSKVEAADGRKLVPPHLVVMQNGKMVDYVGDARPMAAPFFYSGVNAVGGVNLACFIGKREQFVTAYIERVMSLNTGDRIQVGKSNDEMFGSADSYAQYVGQISNESVLPPQTSAVGYTPGAVAGRPKEDWE